MTQPDVIVVGGGWAGAACARQLAIQHLSVRILDSGSEDGIASTAAAGMLAPLAESAPEDPYSACRYAGATFITNSPPR